MQGEKILIIDDEDFILDLSRDILTNSNYSVKTVSDGREGMRFLETEKFDLLLTDVRMPDIDGLDVVKQVRLTNKELPIIIITGHGTLDTSIKALRLGAQGFLLKPFTPAELRSAVSEALEKARLLRENIRMRALMPLFEVSKEIISEVDPKRLLGRIIDIAVKETRADRAFVCLIDEMTGEILTMEDCGLSSSFSSQLIERYGRKIAARIVEEKKPLIITPSDKLPPDLEGMREFEGISSNIYMPMTVRGNVIGILHISRAGAERHFSPSEIELVSVLGGQAAAAIENARLYEKLEQSYLDTIVTLSGVVEARDFYTDKHMKDIAEYSVEIAQKLNLPERDIENIRKAALLHDLGKISVPDHILMKPGKLTDEEMDIVKRHPVNGAKIIEPVEPLKPAMEIIKYHQECFDGSGYPDGLRAEDIPLGARIIAVADAFGAMTTDRPYRKALSVDAAVEELMRFAGTQFDPHVVKMFISLLEEKGVI